MDVFSIKKSGNEHLNSKLLSFPSSQGSEKNNETSKNSKKLMVKQNIHQKAEYPKMLEIAQKVRQKLQSINVNIQFEINKELGRIIIKVLDPVTGEVIRKIPPEMYMRSVQVINEMKDDLLFEGIEIDVKF